jgi:acetyltransferase-like isoleucine patch superfamily enzyme
MSRKVIIIGAGAVINCGVSVDENTLIGAGSVVVSDIPAGVKAFGVPAQICEK